MAKQRIVSKFKQNRSAKTQQKIIEAAEDCFCRNGYFGSSIQKLAAAADVSVGSFYFYFKDKDELMVEVYRRQSEKFIQTVCGALQKTNQYRENRKAWLREFILDLLKTYGDSGKLRLELKALNCANPRFNLQRKQIKEETVARIMEAAENSLMKYDLKVRYPQTALLLTIDMADSTYERIADEDSETCREESIEECLDAVYKYLFL